MKLRSSITMMALLGLLLGSLGAVPPPSQTSLAAPAATIRYAKPGGSSGGDCSAWATACELRYALGVAQDGDEIWVAAGIYKPAADTNRWATFRLRQNVKLYGGFPSGGGSWEQRDWVTHVTILSGDLLNNDGPSSTGIDDNSYHLVFADGIDGIDATSVLDGFTIMAGNANGAAWPNQTGGGMFIFFSSPTVTNVIFSGNRAVLGGGMYNDNSSPVLTNVTFSNYNEGTSGAGMYNRYSSPTLTNVTFSDNHAWGLDAGGGMYNEYSNPTLTGVRFLVNVARTFTAGGAKGGGMYNNNSSPTLTDVEFRGNAAPQAGGGMYNINSSPELTSVTFDGNSAGYDDQTGGHHGLGGGGMYNDSSGPTLTTVTFSGNTAHSYGGGMRNDGNSSLTLTDVEFTGNTADLSGGGMFNDNSSPVLTDVIFEGNEAAYLFGGGMYNLNSSPTLTRVKFEENTAADEDGGGMYNDLSSPTLTDVTFSGNTTADRGGGMYNVYSSPILTGKIIFSGNTAGYDGGGMYSDHSSPTLTDVTFSGNTAGYDGGGMYNDLGSATLTNVTFSGNTADEDGGGMYNTNSSPMLTKEITFTGNTAGSWGGGMYNYKGFPKLTDVTFEENQAINQSGGGMSNQWSTPTLGDVTFSGNTAEAFGGGMHNRWSSPELTRVTFSSNAAFSGGGMLNDNSSPALTRVTFGGNTARNVGGGMANIVNSSPVLIDTTFSGNSATNFGGGMFNDNSSPQIVQTLFYSNTALISGGAMHNSTCQATSPVSLTNVLFSANRATGVGDQGKGGGLYNDNCPAVLTNVTFAHNQAGSYGGGVFATGNLPPVLQNSLLWGNSGAGTTADDQFHSDTPVVPMNTTIQQSEDDPSPFVDADGPDDTPGTPDDDLHPGYPSGAVIDGGLESKLPPDTYDLDGDGERDELLSTDFDGHPRIYADNDLDGLPDDVHILETDDRQQVDRGAYEAGCWAWHMKTGHDSLDDGRDYRLGFHYKIDEITDPRTITQTLAAYALERANGNLDRALTSFELAIACAGTITQTRQATRGMLDVIWEKATGAMLQGNEEMVQVLDVSNSQESATAEISQLTRARNYYNEAVLGYLEPLASDDFDLLLETMAISTTHPISTGDEPRVGLIDVERLLMASSKKSRANLELAERQFRNGLEPTAKQTLEDACNQAKAEMALLYSLWPEAAELADYSAMLRNLGDMERLFSYLAAGKNPLGYDADYVPFSYFQPLDDYNNYIQTKAIADDDLDDAKVAYQAVGAQQKEVDDDWQKMQENLQAAETLYNGKLVVLCGGTGGVPDREHCAGGEIQEQREVVENAMLQAQLVLQKMQNQNALILIEQERVAAEKGIRYATARLITQTGEELGSYAKQEVEIELKKSTMEGIGGIFKGFMGGFSPLGVATPSDINMGYRLFAGILGGVTAGLEWQNQNKKADKLADIAAAKERLYAKQQASVQYAEGDIADANSLALQKQYMLKFAELDVDLAISLNNLEKELAHLVNLHNQAEYALAELAKNQAFTVLLFSDPAGRALRVRNMEMAHAAYERALESAFKAGKALEYQINDDVVYDPNLGPLITLDQIYPLQDLFYLTQGLDQMENAYQDWVPGPTGPATTNAYLSLALGFVDVGDPENPDVTKEALFNAFVKEPANRADQDHDGCPELLFSFQTSNQSGNLLLLPDQVYNDRIKSVEMQVFAYDAGQGLYYGAEKSTVDNISLTQAGTSILRTHDSQLHKGGDDDLRVYNLAPKSILIQANNMSYTGTPVTLLPNTELYSRSVAATEWRIKIEGGSGAACGNLNLDNIGDINLIIKHEYYALPQAQQEGGAGPEALSSLDRQPIELTLPAAPVGYPIHREENARPLATTADVDLDGLFVGALAMTQPLYIPATELVVWLEDSGGSLTGYISPTLTFPAVASTGHGPALTGSWSGDAFSLQSQPFVTDLAPGLVVTRTISMQQGIIASTEITRSLSGVYVEVIQGLTPDPLENRGFFRMERPLRRLQAGFGASPRSVAVGDNVFFSDLSLGNPTGWSWTFGDGSTSTEQDPVHAYAATGTYDVTLSITDGAGSNTLTQAEFISVEQPLGPPHAGFVADPVSGPVGTLVHFYDQSTGGATSWLWNFGDGGTSTQRNPTHAYGAPGLYTVSFRVANSYGQDTYTRVDYIEIKTVGNNLYLPLILRATP